MQVLQLQVYFVKASDNWRALTPFQVSELSVVDRFDIAVGYTPQFSDSLEMPLTPTLCPGGDTLLSSSLGHNSPPGEAVCGSQRRHSCEVVREQDQAAGFLLQRTGGQLQAGVQYA